MPDWPEIIRAYSPVVWKAVYRLVGNRAEAPDCFQDTFVRALQVAREGPVRNWPALLTTLATQAALDRLRRRIRRDHRQVHVSDWSAVHGREPGPGEQAERAELVSRMREALMDLPAQQAEVFALREFSGLSYLEIAELIGISSSAVGVQLHRARQRLTEILNTESTTTKGCTHA